MINIKDLKINFYRKFGKNNKFNIYFAPGRINLIGEHTDYNGGHVFPCAITFGTYAVASLRDDTNVRLFSENFSDLPIIEFDLGNLTYKKEHSWTNYPKGVLLEFMKREFKIDKGFDMYIYGNIPNGAGLSSSASIELVTSVMLKDLFKIDIEMIEMIKLCQSVENNFIGVNSGIMDQFAVGMGKANHAILLDTNTLKYEYVGLDLTGISIVISNTNKRRELADSKYNERRNECDTSLLELQTELDINSLGELSIQSFNKHRHLIKDNIRVKRVKHAVSENLRTLDSLRALKNNDIIKFGELMNQSHISLRDDYEVTGFELDTLVSLAWDEKGVIGSRMTGAGFGGCSISLVKDDYVNSFINNVGQKYNNIVGYEASFYVASIGEGARKLMGDNI